MEFENYMDMLFTGEPIESTPMDYDPEFQSRMNLIQEAFAVNGNTQASPDAMPGLYDALLLELIDSIPLE